MLARNTLKIKNI
jgi:hypothetical protein